MACTTEEIKNLGLSECNEFPSLISNMIETPQDFAIPAATLASGDAAIQTYLQNALLGVAASRIFVWPGFSKEPEDTSEAEVYEDSPLKLRQVRKGNQRFKFFVSENLCLHKNMQTHKRTSGRVFLIDTNGYLIGTLKSNGDFAGLSLALLNPEKLMWATGSTVSVSPIYVALANSGIEFDKNGYMYNASEFVLELESIVDVALTIVGAPSTTLITVDVKASCDGTAISGLVTADFILLDNDDGLAHAKTVTAVAGIPGRYNLTGVAFEDSTLTLASPLLLTIQSYESTGSVVVNVP